MRIDLHCHTKKVKSGDPESRNVEIDMFAEKINDSDVQIAAITNHNHFDYEQYKEFSNAVKSHCQIWPGVELDVKNTVGNRWHLVVVSNPKNAEAFSYSIEKMMINEDVDNCAFEIQQVHNSIKECDVIYIAHFHKKPAVSEIDLQELLNITGDESRVFHETPDKKSLGVFANHDYKVIIGSDVQDWRTYEKNSFAELRLPVSSFEQFCLLSKRDRLVVDTLLRKKKTYEIIASPHKSITFPLCVFEEVNIIFGQKGTGKSEILKSLYNNLSSQGLNCEMYIGSEKESNFKSLLSNSDLKRDLSKLKVDSCEKEFEILTKWGDCNPTLFSNYINWWETKENNANKNRMKITDATEEAEPNSKKYDFIKKDFRAIKQVMKILSEIEVESYITKEVSIKLIDVISDLEASIIKVLKSEFNSIYSTKLVNYSINRIKTIADKNSNTISKPSSTGFYKFASNRISLLATAEKILQNINGKEFYERHPIGELEDKGVIYIRHRYRMLCENSRTDEFQHGIRVLRDIKSLLTSVRHNWYKGEVYDDTLQLKNKCNDSEINSTIDFLGLSKYTASEDNNEYSPSSGEQSILLMQRILHSGADAYFLDEPELGMGNSYIDTNIRPRISELGKLGKVVVVATHNANIAVRTLPYNCIFRIHENGKYSTFIGNPFANELVNIEDNNDKKSWKTESMHTLEGGEEAFYERKSIYESGNNQS